MGEDLQQEIVSNIRSCLVSAKGKITIRQLENDYMTLIGQRIPYNRLGHASVAAFLASVPEAFVVSRGNDGQIYVDARITAKSAHITEMVCKQKPPKPKKHSRPPRFNYQHRQLNHNHHHHNQAATLAISRAAQSNWRPYNTRSLIGHPLQQQRKRQLIQPPPRLAVVSHNQFIANYPTGNNHRADSGGGGDGGGPGRQPIIQPKMQPYRQTNDNRPPPPQPSVQAEQQAVKTKETGPREARLQKKEGIVEEKRDGKLGQKEGKRTEETNGNSVLTSVKKRLSRYMTERDSGNSSPTLDEIKTSEFERTADPISDLKTFVELHRLGTIDVKFTEKSEKKHRGPKKTVEFYCKIKIGNQYSYSSYPQDCATALDAERLASKQALDDLVTKHTRRHSLLISSDEDVIARIPPMLERHQTAVWQSQVESDYEEQYEEKLPSDWLQVVDRTVDKISIEKCHGGYVLKFCNSNDILQKGKKVVDLNMSITDVSVPSNTIQLSAANRLIAVVTAAPSAAEIWCLNSNTDEYTRFIALMEEIEQHYAEHGSTLVAPSISWGCCYVIKTEGGWVRARAVAQPEQGIVDCFLLDYGEQVDVPVANVHLMKRKYASMQAQAFVCRLDGLEELYDTSHDSTRLSDLIGHDYVVEVRMDDSDMSRQHLPVVLYDIETGKSVNEELITLLTSDSALPRLNKNAVTEVYVSNIERNGDVYVQIHTPGFQRLQEMLLELNEAVKEEIPEQLTCTANSLTPENSQNKLFLIKSKVTGKWQRAAIIDWSPKTRHCQVLFVDYGNTAVVNLENEMLLPLDQWDHQVVAKYPGQALKVRMLLDEVPVDFVQMALKLMPSDQEILLKLVKTDADGVAVVEFYKRSQEAGGLFCINKSIAVEAELQSVNARANLLNLARYNENSMPSGGLLSKPKLPGKGEYFSVNIPFAVNPYNFFVQPLETMKELTALMQAMQEDYKSMQYSPLQITDVEPGKIYASKHEDGLYYRTSVLKIINPGSISVFYCDFGHYTNLSVDQLMPLHKKYLQFPYQALKAKLVGIKPVQNRWTMEDCDFFKNLVTSRQYVSVLCDIEEDPVQKSDIVLNLALIDTTSEKDLHLKDLLIEKGMAVAV